MTPKNWHWDLNLSPDAINAILTNDQHPQFAYVAARLLSSTDDSKYVFSLMTPLVLYRNFPAIRRALQRDQWKQETLVLWEATYRRYAREFKEAGVRVRRKSVLAVDPLTAAVLEQMQAARARAGITQHELAKQLQCSQQLVSAIERGREKLTIDYLRRFAEATGCRPEVFLHSTAQERTVQSSQKTAEDYEGLTKWVEDKRRKALESARVSNLSRGLMEVVAYLPDSILNARQDAWDMPSGDSLKARQHQLLNAMEHTQVHTFGWPIGIVVDKEEWRPRFSQDGIWAEINIPNESQYDYWVLRRDLSFYLLTSLFEDQRAEGKIFFDTRIVRTAETILRIARLYRSPEFGRSARDRVVIKIRYLGLKGRKLASANPGRHLSDRRPCFENEAETVIQAPLGKLEANLVDLVHSAVGDLLVLFDGFVLDKDRVVKDIVERFSKGQI
ncbi:MAG: hypothetical protein A3C53_00525 [Omnitrophica WOR_2 bacterium RIFCSPHIGHO2_02_FULL_68_15]|nr:MAG: hypothetical protein A3C53_00525 [Omnitrophica WOR_2 bacterium RIFCSPHIGHO2_02_FULL_68_15]